MTDYAIRMEGLSKEFRLGPATESYKTLRDSIANLFLSRLRSNRPAKVKSEDTFWALKDITLWIKPGEVVGIIGRNGAGKSTLLKILSYITEPTSGIAEIRGRISSLLEVGTGFHGELTGRENIYLNGAILGMTRAEINRKFDEIVAFAEVEKFIDTPVKHYSSGMYLRLAFAVAAHLDPEILIVDEVLAVGDANFQRKCLNKMHDVSQKGRTILFVSHNMPAITSLCDRAIWLDRGQVVKDGDPQHVVSSYLSAGTVVSGVREWLEPSIAPGNEIVQLRAVRLRLPNGDTDSVIDIREPFSIEVEYDVTKAGYVLAPNIGFDNEEGACIFVLGDQDPYWRNQPRPVGLFISKVFVPGNFLADGTINVGAGIITENPFVVHCDESRAIAFQVIDSFEGNAARRNYTGKIPGFVRPVFKWETQCIPNRPALQDRFNRKEE
jgi:lipopolysaccharide transport system ATP-binding protein